MNTRTTVANPGQVLLEGMYIVNCFTFYCIVICCTATLTWSFPVNRPRKTRKYHKARQSFIQRHDAAGSSSRHKTAERQSKGSDYSPLGELSKVRFAQRVNAVSTSSVDDNFRAKTRETLLSEEDLVRAKRKRAIAARLRGAADEAARAAESISSSGSGGNKANATETGRRLSNEEFEAIANSRRAKVLEFEADRLELLARRHKQLAEGAILDETGFPVCDMLKIGPLEFVPTLDEVRHRVDHTVTGQLLGRSLTIFQKKRPKLTYDIESIALPIFNVPDTGEACWGFSYHGVDQLFCAANKLSRDSWIDAMSEAWFCQSEGLQGMLPSIEATEEEMLTKEKVAKPTPAPKETKEEEPQPLIDINVGMDQQQRPNVTINGQQITPKGKL